MKSILIEYFGKNGAGIPITYEMAMGFLHSNLKVFLLLSSKVENKAMWDELAKRNKEVEVFFIDTGNKKTFLAKSLQFLFCREKYLKEIKKYKIDYALRSFPHPWMEFVERYLQIERVLFILHDPIPHSGTQWYRRLIAKRSIKTADEIIVLAQKFKSVVPELYGVDPSHVFGMKIGLIHPSENPQDEANFDLSEFAHNTINFVFFGRIDQYKGLHLLADAYKQLPYENIGLIVAGSGDFSEYENKYNLLKHCKVINRYINDKEVNTIFSANKVVIVLPYIDATQSGVVTLAAEYECPIIASDAGALKEQLDEGRVGVFFPGEDMDSLVNCMNRFINDHTLYYSEKEKMKKYKLSLDWDLIIQNLVNDLQLKQE